MREIYNDNESVFLNHCYWKMNNTNMNRSELLKWTSALLWKSADLQNNKFINQTTWIQANFLCIPEYKIYFV